MVMELTGPVDEADQDRLDLFDDPTRRMVRAIDALDALDHDTRARERARTVVLGRMLLLAIGLVLLVAIVLTVNDLILGAIHDIDQGL